MSLHSPLKLFVGGCGMITSCSIWLFDGQKTPLPEALTSTPPETAEVKQETTEAISNTLTPVVSVQPTQTTPAAPIYLDIVPAVDKLSGWVGKAKEDSNIKAESNVVNTSITVSFIDDSNREKIVLSPVKSEIDDFQVLNNSTKKQYQDFDKKLIRISLFKDPAWYSTTKIDEYQEPLDYEQFSDLFKDTDEVRVKQLLLSLHNRVEWKWFWGNQYYADAKYADDMDQLKELKIKYFKDFDSLNKYVKAKVETCGTDTRSCIPTKWEFDYMETDTTVYFENIWKSK